MVQEHHPLKLAVLGTVLLLAGCPAPEPRPAPPAPAVVAPSDNPSVRILPTPAPQPPAAPAPRPPPVRENHLSPATRALVTQAHALLTKGDMDGASSTLDRALRIEPGNPLLWIELGRLRLTEGDAHQAEGCGRKALALASGDRSAQRQATHVLAEALRAQGRNQEAHELEGAP